MYKNERQVCAAFWRGNPGYKLFRLGTRIESGTDKYGRPKYRTVYPQNMQRCDVRVAFCDFVDALHRAGLISDDLAQTVTLN